MLPTAHFFSGIVIYRLLVMLDLIQNNLLFVTLIVTCSMIPDLDNLFLSLHRNFFTHTPIFWGTITAIISIIAPSYWLVIFPFSIHLFLDTIDYGIMVFFPASRKKFGLGLLGKGPGITSKSDITYFREYLKNPKMLSIEVIIMMISLLLTIPVIID